MSADEVLLGDPDVHGTRTLTLNRPEKANALNTSVVEVVHRKLDTLDDETRILVVTGAGRHFCGGFDFAAYEEQSEGDLLLRFVRINELLARLRRARYLTVAWVQGAAYGAGADIVCACAVRLGTAGARFRFPGFQFGVALGTRRLAHIVGQSRAREILSCNEELDAEHAQSCGILGEVLPDEARDARLAELVRSIGGLDAPAMQCLFSITEPDTEDADLADLVRSVARPGFHERIARFRAGSAK